MVTVLKKGGFCVPHDWLKWGTVAVCDRASKSFAPANRALISWSPANITFISFISSYEATRWANLCPGAAGPLVGFVCFAINQQRQFAILIVCCSGNHPLVYKSKWTVRVESTHNYVGNHTSFVILLTYFYNPSFIEVLKILTQSA